MLIQGVWYLCDDGLVRPVLKGEVRGPTGQWDKVAFLVDSGADRTVFSADIVELLQLPATAATASLGGVGGTARAIPVNAPIRLDSVDRGKITINGPFAAFIDPQAMDMSVMGRDLLNLFAVILDRPQDLVCLLGQHHRYQIIQDKPPSS